MNVRLTIGCVSFLVSAVGSLCARAQDSLGHEFDNLQYSSAAEAWTAFDQCPVMVEREVQIPAVEDGVLESLVVELNDTVKQGERIGHLDYAIAQMALNATKLELSVAQKLASDDSDVQFNQLALQEVTEELENLQSINRSVSGSELRALKLRVGKQEVALTRAKQKRTRDNMAAQLKASEVEAASQKLQRRAIHAPFDGVVTEIEKHAGAYVRAGEAVVTIRNLDHLVVDRLLPLKLLKLETIIGSEVRVETEDGAELSGVVTSYDSEVNSRGEIRIHTRIANAVEDGQWVLLPRMYVTMFLQSKHIRSADVDGIPSESRLISTPTP